MAARILVTNDDGYTSEGIQVLADALDGLGAYGGYTVSERGIRDVWAPSLHRPVHRFPDLELVAS